MEEAGMLERMREEPSREILLQTKAVQLGVGCMHVARRMYTSR